MENAKVKPAVFPSRQIYKPWACSPECAPARINYRGHLLSLTGGPHHDRGGHTTADGPSSRRRTGRAVAGGHIRLPTPPTTRAAAAPKKARPRRETAAATVKH
jgi:hypothetical protein